MGSEGVTKYVQVRMDFSEVSRLAFTSQINQSLHWDLQRAGADLDAPGSYIVYSEDRVDCAYVATWYKLPEASDVQS